MRYNHRAWLPGVRTRKKKKKSLNMHFRVAGSYEEAREVDHLGEIRNPK